MQIETLPFHPTLGVQALGLNRKGLPIWPQRGGAEDGDGEAAGAGEKTFTQADVDRLMGETRRKAKPADYDDLKTKAAKLDEIEAASASDLEKAVNAAKKETEDAIRAEVRRERVLDRVEVLAAKDFADADDARLRMEKRADEFVTKDGEVDADAIKTALAQLLKDKPHLAANTAPIDLGQGVRKADKPDPGPGASRMRAAYAASSKTP